MTTRWHDIGAIEDFPEEKARGCEAAGQRLCIVNAGEGLFALADICTHGHAFLSEGDCDVAEGVVECPLHGGLFDFRTGAPMGKPAERDAPVYEVRVENGRVLVRIDA